MKFLKNFVFDIGNVLLSFKPREYLEEKIPDEKQRKEFYKEVFLSKGWEQLDRGTVSKDEVIENIYERKPHLKPLMETVFKGWEDLLKPIDGTVEILETLVENGYKAYALSNFHREAFQRAYDTYQFMELFKGLVISAHVNYLKPEPEIFQYLIKRYELDPLESLFIDDTRENIITAAEIGFQTFHFTNSGELKFYLQNRGIL